MAPLIRIDEDVTYITVTRIINSQSEFEEISEGKFQYVRKGKTKFDELIVIRPNNTKITYILDVRSKLVYQKLSGHELALKGQVYERQPAKE